MRFSEQNGAAEREAEFEGHDNSLKADWWIVSHAIIWLARSKGARRIYKGKVVEVFLPLSTFFDARDVASTTLTPNTFTDKTPPKFSKLSKPAHPSSLLEPGN